MEKQTDNKTQFLANMSHEIRTPLSLILGFTEELMGSTEPTDANKQLINIIRRNSQILARLVDDILDLSRVEAGKLDFNIEPLFTADFLNDLEANCRAKCLEKGLDFHIESTPDLPVKFISDEVRLKQILMNLVGNSVKYTSKGSVSIKASYRHSDNKVCFEVIDSGEGIPEAQQSFIFDIFQQGSPKSKPGTGLGLPLARNLARGLHGDVSLTKSVPGEGSWFHVEIKDLPEQVEMPHLSIVSVPPPDLSQWKILIVDDLSDNLQLMEIILKPTKAMVESTICPYKAVEKAGKGNYDLILVDLQMPEMDGYDTLRAAKAAGHKGQAWAVSAHAMKTDVIHCLQAGFSEHVSKPIQRNDFYKKLHAAKIARQI